MNKIKLKFKDFARYTISLQYTTKVPVRPRNSIGLKLLKDCYGTKNTEWNVKIAASLMNSLFTHKRKVFCLTRSILRDIVEKDVNLTNKGFSNDKYPLFLRTMLGSNIIKKIDEVQVGNNKKSVVAIYELIDEDFLTMFKEDNIDTKLQKSEVLEFLSNFGTEVISDNPTIDSDSSEPAVKKLNKTSNSRFMISNDKYVITKNDYKLSSPCFLGELPKKDQTEFEMQRRLGCFPESKRSDVVRIFLGLDVKKQEILIP